MEIKKTAFVALALLVASSQVSAAFLPVCHRTKSVRDFIEQSLSKTCDTIVAEDLLSIKRIDVGGTNTREFKTDDFTGLTNLEILNIRSNPYTTLPEGLFTDLVNMNTLVIIATSLRYYPDDFLEHNPKMQNLHSFRNKVRSISESVLQRLEKFDALVAVDFDAALQEPEKARLLKAFPAGGRVTLDLIP